MQQLHSLTLYPAAAPNVASCKHLHREQLRVSSPKQHPNYNAVAKVLVLLLVVLLLFCDYGNGVCVLVVFAVCSGIVVAGVVVMVAVAASFDDVVALLLRCCRPCGFCFRG